MVKKLALFTILISGSYLFSMELPSAKVDEVVIACADGNTSIPRIIFKAILLNSKTLKNYLESTGQSAAEINEIPLKALSIRQVEFIAKYSTHLGQKSELIEEFSKKDISLFNLQIILKTADYLEIDNLYKAAISVLAKKAVELAKKDPTSVNFNELSNDLDRVLVAAMIESDPAFLSDFFGNIKVQSIFERKETYRVSPQKPAAMAISPNGKTLAVLSGNLIKIIDSESKKEIQVIELSSDEKFNALTFSPDGNMIAGIFWSGAIAVWDAKTGNELWRLQQPILGTWSNFYAIKFSHNGQKVARNNNRSVDFFDANSGALIKTLPTNIDWAQFAFSNDDQSIFVTMRGASDKEYLVERYDLETLNVVGEPLVIVGDPHGALMDEKYERMVTYGPYKLPQETTTVTVWNLETKSNQLFEIPSVVKGPHFFGIDGLIFASGRPFEMVFSEIIFYNMKMRKIIKSLPVPQITNEMIHIGGQLVGISGYSEKESNYYVFDFSQLESVMAQLKKLSSKQFALILYAVMNPAVKAKRIDLKNNQAFTKAFESLPLQLQEIIGKSARIKVGSCPIM